MSHGLANKDCIYENGIFILLYLFKAIYPKKTSKGDIRSKPCTVAEGKSFIVTLLYKTGAFLSLLLLPCCPSILTITSNNL